MSIFFIKSTLGWVGRCISIVKVATGTPSAYKFNNKSNSQILMTMASWPLSPLSVP